jgi:hypothetical protein
LLAHNPSLDDTFFVAKFVKGLKKHIGAAIVLHQPGTVDDAIYLALIQEANLKNMSSHVMCVLWHNKAGPGKLGPHRAEAILPEAAKAAPVAIRDIITGTTRSSLRLSMFSTVDRISCPSLAARSRFSRAVPEYP